MSVKLSISVSYIPMQHLLSPGHIYILLGCDQFFMCLCGCQIFKNFALPIAQNIQFGWIIGGDFDASQEHDGMAILAFPLHQTNKPLQRFWDIEELSV